MNLQKVRKQDFNLNDYKGIVETVAKVEYKKLSSSYIMDFDEVLNISFQTLHALSTFAGFECYKTSYISTAIKWAIRNEVRRRYRWYNTKKSTQQHSLPEDLPFSQEELREAVYSTIMSIDEMSSDEHSQPFQIKDTNYTPDEYAEFLDLKKILIKALSILPERERALVEAKFFNEKKLTELTEEFGLSPSRITRIIQSALSKLKVELEKQNVN